VNSSLSFRDVLTLRHFPALDGMRAIAVLIVILGHTEYPIKGVPADLGVSVFFVLSGFLITRLLMRESDKTGTVSLKQFYIRRTLRIFPAYYAFLALSYALDWRAGQVWPTSMTLSAITYTINYFNALHNHPSTSIAHAWSLAVEEQFYLLWPLVFLLARTRARQIKAVLAMAGLVVVWRCIAALNGAPVAYLYNVFETRFDNLAIGCALALCAEQLADTITALSARAWYPLITTALLLTSRLMFGAKYHYMLGFTVDALLLALFLMQVMTLYRSPLWAWLNHSAIRFVGTISYPMYLYHAWGGSIGRRAATTQPWEFLATLAATLLLACGSYFVIERPFLSLKERFRRVPVEDVASAA
jgi:peptidoglycan/LPS O-acetylase OafA/YrhL